MAKKIGGDEFNEPKKENTQKKSKKGKTVYNVPEVKKRKKKRSEKLRISLCILFLIGIAYIVIVAKPQWAKAVFFFEGIIIGISGYTLLATPYNYLLGIIGLAIVVIAVLAYLQKLPMSILKYFYR